MIEENTIITCCPACQTRFKVTQGQLKIADNTVRCGSCLAVFSAIEHQIQQRKQPSIEPQIKAKQTQPTPPSSETVSNVKEEVQLSETTSESATKPAPVFQAADSEHKQTQKPSVKNNPEIPTLIVETEPVTLQLKPQKKNGISVTWLLSCLLAILLLAGQHLWFNRSTLYWEPTLHPIYVQICSHINCPDFYQQDIDKIENLQLVIQQHSLYEGAAHISLLLKNHALFKQPFPALKLTFKDLKGRIVSHRIFQPNEYLDESRANVLAMPSQTPIQISLDIMTPGSRGVSYELELLAPHL